MGLDVQQVDGLVTVRIDHGKVNALDLELCRDISAVFDAHADDPTVSAMVLTGRDGVFSGGVDVTRILDGGAAYAREFLTALSGAFLSVARCRRPVVAAVNGHAIAGGAVLARAADVVLAAGAGRIGLVELRVGVPFPPAAMEVLRVRLGSAELTRVVLDATARPFSEHVGGLIDRLVDEGELSKRSIEEARRLGSVPVETYALTKQVLLAPLEATLSSSAPRWEAPVAQAWATEEVRSAIRRSVESRGRE